MYLKKLFLIGLLPFVVLACGNKEEESTTKKEDKKSSETISSINSPCEFLTKEEIISTFLIPSDIEITIEEKEYTQPTCKIVWDDGKLIETKIIGGNPVKIKLKEEILIIYVKNANESMFERSISVYKDGIEVTDLAEKAIWSDKRHQLTFLKNGNLFHINVMVSNDVATNKIYALVLANLIIDKL